MLLHVCTNYFQKSEMLEIIKAGSQNTASRDVWLSKDSTGFVVVDNRDGNAWTEHFDRLLDALAFGISYDGDREVESFSDSTESEVAKEIV